jgi:L-asparaginase
MNPIKIFTTGGSIDKFYSTHSSQFEVGPAQATAILEDGNVGFEYNVEALLAKDSLEITALDREMIARQVRLETCQRILITHGTDTMVDTALALMEIPGKVIVLTGSMQPAAFKHSDAPFNLGFALAALQILPEGVYIAINGRVFDPRRARKNLVLDQFEELKA